MSEYDEINVPSKNEVKDKVKEKVADIQDQVQLDEHTVHLIRTNAVQVVTCLAVVGILINNRRSLKFTKKVVQNMDRNMLQTQNTIKTLKEAGKTFEFYPGVGLWVH